MIVPFLIYITIDEGIKAFFTRQNNRNELNSRDFDGSIIYGQSLPFVIYEN